MLSPNQLTDCWILTVLLPIYRHINYQTKRNGTFSGLQFTLPLLELKKRNYLANFEMLFSRLGEACFLGSNDDKLYFKNKLRDYAFSSLYNFNSIRKHLSNIKSLSKNKDIVVMKPDKGTGIAILNTTDM